MIYRKIFNNYLRLSLLALILIILSTSVFLSLFNVYKTNQPNLEIIFNSLPKTTLNLLRLTPNSFTDLIYYYAIYLNFGSLIYFILAIALAIKTIKDDSKYNSIFITKVENKTTYLKKKILFAVTCLLLVNLISYLYLIIHFSFYFSSNKYLILLLLQLALFLTELTIYSLILAISSFLIKSPYIIITTVVVLFVFIILAAIYKTTNLKFIAYLDPICYFDYLKIITDKALSLDYLAAIVIIVVFGLNFALCEYDGGINV